MQSCVPTERGGSASGRDPVARDPWRELLPALPEPLRGWFGAAMEQAPGPLEELRLRVGQPVLCLFGEQERALQAGGGWCGAARPGQPPAGAWRPGADDIRRSLELLCQHSVYAWEDQLRNGFITLPGGHRVGLAGRAVVEGGRVQTLRPVGSLNYRLAREVAGCALELLPRVVDPAARRVRSLLLVSPPRAGKTTLLRDLVRLLADGDPRSGWPGARVTVVDERSEIAGSSQGVPGRDVGFRTDVLDQCPKAEGLMMAIRALAPAVVAVDEIGRAEDAVALEEALHAGVAVIATAHGPDLDAVARRPSLRRLFELDLFEVAAVLSRRRGPGTVERVAHLRART